MNQPVANINAFRRLAYLTFAGAALDFAFWTLYLTGVVTLAEDGNKAVTLFESAFLFADCMLGIVLVVAGIGLLKGKAFGGFFLIAASSMAIYLGILDVTFYAGQNLYSPLSLSTGFEILINAACIFGGVAGLVMAALLRRMGHATSAAKAG